MSYLKKKRLLTFGFQLSTTAS